MTLSIPRAGSGIILPPLRTVLDNLERVGDKPQLPSLGKIYESHEHDRQIIQLPTAPCIHQGRQIAIASSMSSEALAPLPACAPQSLTPPQSRPKVPPMPIKLRLAPTTFDNADAIVFVPPALPHARQPQALLFVGPALQRLRNPPRPLAKGLRLHPYRIVRRIHPSTVRRTPMAPANMNIRD